MNSTWTCACGQSNVGRAPCDRCFGAAPGWVAEPGAAAPPRRGALVRTLAVAIVVLLVGGLVGVVAVADERTTGLDSGVGGLDDGPSHTVRIEPDGSTPAGGSAEIAAAIREVAALHGFVAQARGLAWSAPVEVTFFSPADFVRRLQEQNERDVEDLDELAETARVLSALRLLDDDVDLEDAVDDLLAGAVVGFYDPETDELAVRGTDLEAFNVRATIVHELTHALQDQVFDLHRPALDEREDESSMAFSAVVEGDAVRVEGLYLESLPLADRKRAEQQEIEAALGAGIGPDTPRILLELIGFPYIFGPPFVAAVVEAGGQERLDQAFREPPVTTEQILDPALFLSGVGPAEVVKPEADGEVIDEGVMGEYILGLLLSRADDGSADAAENWRGDWYRAWDQDGHTCVRTRVATAGVEATRELQRSLDGWRRAQGSVTVSVEPAGTILFTSCG